MIPDDASHAAIRALPPLREVIREQQLGASKAFGQNFILDLNLTARITRAAGDLSGRQVLEVGPGPGGLTRALLLSPARQVLAIEADPRCLPALAPLVAAAAGRLDLRLGDALEVDAAAHLPAPRVVVANLPYHVATPLLIGWMLSGAWESLTVMLQREVAERLVASPGSSAYGRLSVLAQALGQGRVALTLPPSAFVPPPKVHSAVLHWQPHPQPPPSAVIQALERLTAAGFGQRRKMLRSSLGAVLADPVGTLTALGLDPAARAEMIAVRDWLRLAQSLI